MAQLIADYGSFFFGMSVGVFIFSWIGCIVIGKMHNDLKNLDALYEKQNPRTDTTDE